MSWLERGRRYASRFGEPMEFSDPFVQALVLPGVNAAFKSLPRYVSLTNVIGRQLQPLFFCVENSEPPSIFCNADEEFYYIILNKNLVWYLFNISRQIFCMREVLSFIGEPKRERRTRTTYNRVADIFGFKFNRYDANTNVEFLAVSPNKEPRCLIRQKAYVLLFYFMLKSLVSHEIAHILQGHIELVKAEAVKERLTGKIDVLEKTANPESVNAAVFSEIMADVLSMQSFVSVESRRLQSSYGSFSLWSVLPITQTITLRRLAPPLAYWSFSSFDLEFCMDIRKHKMALVGHLEDGDEIAAHVSKNLRIELIESLVDPEKSKNKKGTDKAYEELRNILKIARGEFREHLRFYEPLDRT